MTISHNYEPGTTVFLVVGSNENAKIVSGEILSVNITKIKSGLITINYNVSVSRDKLNNSVSGSPSQFILTRSENKLYETQEDCVKNITK